MTTLSHSLSRPAVLQQSHAMLLNRNHTQMKGLIGWWPLWEGAGETAFDLSPYRTHGTLTNMDQSSDWVVGRRGGQALDFDGVDDHVDCGNSSHFDDGHSGFAISAWALLTSPHGKDHALVTKDNVSQRSFQFLQLGGTASANDKLRFSLRVGGTYYTVDSDAAAWPDDGQRHHAVAVYNGANIRVFIDGDHTGGTTSCTGTTTTTTAGLLIGRRGDGFADLDGQVQDVRIWGRGLSNVEVRDLYLNPTAPFKRQAVVPDITAAPPAAADFPFIKYYMGTGVI